MRIRLSVLGAILLVTCSAVAQLATASVDQIAEAGVFDGLLYSNNSLGNEIVESGRLVGIVTDRDMVVRAVADGSLAGIIAMADVALQMEDEREIAETLEEISSGAAFWGKR